MTNQIYPTDLTDSQRNLIKELLPPAKPGGRPRSLDMSLVINSICYVVVGGIKWRMLPREYPKWKSVYHYFRQWRISGDWQRLHDTIRAQVRQPGYAAAKQITGRKRHLLVDTLGLLLLVAVTAASVQERDGARTVFNRLRGGCKKLRLSLGWMAAIVGLW